MSLFDVIRCPISDVPTQEELSVIPIPVFIAWHNWVLANNSKVWYTQDSSAIKLRLMLAQYDTQGEDT